MKTGKLVKAIKKSKHLQVVKAVDENGAIFQMVGYAGNLYRIENMPILNDIQMLTFLGMAKEDKGSLNYQEIDTQSKMFHDYYPGEKPVHWRTLMSDPDLKAFWEEEGTECVPEFVSVDSFELADITGSTQAFFRGNENDMYIAIKEGLLLKALLPVREVEVDGRLESLELERKLLERAKGRK